VGTTTTVEVVDEAWTSTVAVDVTSLKMFVNVVSTRGPRCSSRGAAAGVSKFAKCPFSGAGALYGRSASSTPVRSR
jgi:hypothetical protein